MALRSGTGAGPESQLNVFNFMYRPGIKLHHSAPWGQRGPTNRRYAGPRPYVSRLFGGGDHLAADACPYEDSDHALHPASRAANNAHGRLVEAARGAGGSGLARYGVRTHRMYTPPAWQFANPT